MRALARAGHAPVAVSRNPKPWSVDDTAIETFAADYADLGRLAAAVQGADPERGSALINLADIKGK